MFGCREKVGEEKRGERKLNGMYQISIYFNLFPLYSFSISLLHSKHTLKLKCCVESNIHLRKVGKFINWNEKHTNYLFLLFQNHKGILIKGKTLVQFLRSSTLGSPFNFTHVVTLSISQAIKFNCW